MSCDFDLLHSHGKAAVDAWKQSWLSSPGSNGNEDRLAVLAIRICGINVEIMSLDFAIAISQILEHKKGDVSAVIGLGIDLKRFRGNVRYNLGLRDISNDNEGRIRNRGLQVSLGYWLNQNK